MPVLAFAATAVAAMSCVALFVWARILAGHISVMDEQLDRMMEEYYKESSK